MLELITAVRLLQDSNNEEGRIIRPPALQHGGPGLRKHKPRKLFDRSKSQTTTPLR